MSSSARMVLADCADGDVGGSRGGAQLDASSAEVWPPVMSALSGEDFRPRDSRPALVPCSSMTTVADHVRGRAV